MISQVARDSLLCFRLHSNALLYLDGTADVWRSLPEKGLAPGDLSDRSCLQRVGRAI